MSAPLFREAYANSPRATRNMRQQERLGTHVAKLGNDPESGSIDRHGSRDYMEGFTLRKHTARLDYLTIIGCGRSLVEQVANRVVLRHRYRAGRI